MKTILVATDFSSRSDRALLRATQVARDSGASLVLAHIIDDDQPSRLVEKARSSAHDTLAEIAHSLIQQSGVSAQTLVTAADVAACIVDGAEQVKADLIILGPHRSRLLDAFTGTTVERVVRSCRSPLLVAAGTPKGPYHRSLLALDFDEASKVAARTALELGIFDRTHVTVMHAYDVPGEGMMQRSMVDPELIEDHRAAEKGTATSRLHELLDALALPRATTRVAAVIGNPARTILESGRREQADLIILGTSQRQGLARLLVGSVTSDVIRNTQGDILIVPVA